MRLKISSITLPFHFSRQKKKLFYACARFRGNVYSRFRPSMKSDNAVSPLTEWSKRAERWSKLIYSHWECNSIASDQPWPCIARTCMDVCERAHPRGPNVYRIRGSVIITASHIRARAPEFIYSNLFTFARDDSTTRSAGLDLFHLDCSYISQRRFSRGCELLLDSTRKTSVACLRF